MRRSTVKAWFKLYKDAIERATSQPVVETWLYFPVAAGAISVLV